MISLDQLRQEADAALDQVKVGDSLTEATHALIELAVCASVTALDNDGIEACATRALDAGASGAQVHETVVLVSGLGVHSLMEGSSRIAAILRARNDPPAVVPLDERRQQLWAKYVGSDRYWDAVEREVPGFLDALLRLSPEAFEAFFAYCAVPWKTAALAAIDKELISLAVDATPTHRYLPGMRLHLGNALKLGAGRRMIGQALDIAANAPPHQGIGRHTATRPVRRA
jgi:alkylhydroperoxidase/carboxymuconolactone decarboxylase family protein YurZ